MPNYFMGQDGFVWFIGVVEDRNDPSKLGRVKVRCLGFYFLGIAFVIKHYEHHSYLDHHIQSLYE